MTHGVSIVPRRTFCTVAIVRDCSVDSIVLGDSRAVDALPARHVLADVAVDAVAAVRVGVRAVVDVVIVSAAADADAVGQREGLAHRGEADG